MTARRRTFVDTNVLLYAHDASEAEKQPIARALIEELWADGSGVLSTQVLQEFYVVATRKFRPPLGRTEAREIVALYATWPVVQTTNSTTPGTFTVPIGSGSQMYYKIQSQ